MTIHNPTPAGTNPLQLARRVLKHLDDHPLYSHEYDETERIREAAYRVANRLRLTVEEQRGIEAVLAADGVVAGRGVGE